MQVILARPLDWILMPGAHGTRTHVVPKHLTGYEMSGFIGIAVELRGPRATRPLHHQNQYRQQRRGREKQPIRTMNSAAKREQFIL